VKTINENRMKLIIKCKFMDQNNKKIKGVSTRDENILSHISSSVDEVNFTNIKLLLVSIWVLLNSINQKEGQRTKRENASSSIS